MRDISIYGVVYNTSTGALPVGVLGIHYEYPGAYGLSQCEAFDAGLPPQCDTVDAQGGQAGCWRSHTRAWPESATCQAALVLEDDAFFEPASLLQCSAPLEAVLHTPSSLAQGNLEFFLLGWSGHITRKLRS